MRWLVLLTILCTAVAVPSATGSDPTADVSVTLMPSSVDPHVGGGVNLTARVVNNGPDPVPDVAWTMKLSPSLTAGASPTSGHTGPLAAKEAITFGVGGADAHVGTGALTVGVTTQGAADPNSANNVATYTFRSLPAVRTYTELRDPAWSPKGDRIAFVRWTEPGRQSPYPQTTTTGRLLITDGRSAPRPVTPPQPVPAGISWAPDGHSLAYASSGHIWTVDLATHHIRRITGSAPDSARWPTWSPDGTRIAYTTGNRFGVEVAAVVQRDGGGAPTVAAYTSSQVTWSPDGTSILADGQLWPADGRLKPADAAGIIGWSGDATRLLRRDPTMQTLTITTTAGAPVATFPSQPRLTHPSLSWHGDALAGATLAGRAYVIRLPDGALHAVPHADSQNDSVRWSRTGVVAYVGSGRCGPRSEIDMVRANGSGFRTLARACAA